MILKASARGGGQDLAAHLLRLDENEHVLVHELRGFAADDLRGAFKEAEAVSRGTKCGQYLFSLSLSPPESACISAEEFGRTIEDAEARLGLEDQPRAIVFHEKEGRRHAHCVWSRIDADTMTARPVPFFKRKLIDLSRDLYLQHGWKMPNGLAHPGGRDPTNFTLAEWQQAKRLGQDPRWLKSVLQKCWAASDDGRSFARALGEHGFFLAKGDRRSFVVVGHDNEVHSLPRSLGLKTKEVRARLGDGADLPSVADTQALIGRRMSPAIRRHVAETRNRFEERSRALGEKKIAMTKRHREARLSTDELLTNEWNREAKARFERLPRGFSGLWARLTGKHLAQRRENEREAELTRLRHADQRQKLIEAQHSERATLQLQFKELRGGQARQLLTLREEVGRYLRFTRSTDRSLGQSQGRSAGLGLKLQL